MISLPQIGVEELKRSLDAGDPVTILDVREQREWDICNIGGILLPLGELAQRLNQLDPAQSYAVLCHHGVRSSRAVEFLQGRGFTSVVNIAGGIDAWATRVDHGMARY